MTPTNEERREVAARLRRQLKYMRENDSYREDVDILGCGNAAYRNIAWAVDENSNWEKGHYVHIVERLADIIDPTCEVEGSKPLYMDDETEFQLSCGHAVWMVSNCPPAYCPECGARVVDGGEG